MTTGETETLPDEWVGTSLHPVLPNDDDVDVYGTDVGEAIAVDGDEYVHRRGGALPLDECR